MRRLILRPGAIGDCILSFPALQHLVADYTEIWISPPVVPLIRFADTVRPLAYTGIDLLGIGDDHEIRANLGPHFRSFHSVVSWYGANRPEFGETLEEMGVRCVFLQALPKPENSGHATEFFAKQVGADPSLLPHLATACGPSRGTVVIHPFSGGSRKNWPLKSYQQLAAALNAPVEWTAGPHEALESATRFINLAELANWLAGARLYIGNDSGITHLAAACGVRTLALFGPTDPDRWAPRGENVQVLRGEPLEDLSVTTVLAAANRLVGL